jgi:hypothetical protein
VALGDSEWPLFRKLDLPFLGDPFFLLSAVLDLELRPFSEAAFFLWSPFAFLGAASSLPLVDFAPLADLLMLEEEVSGPKRMKKVSSMTSNWDVGDSVVSPEMGNSVVGCSLLMLEDRFFDAFVLGALLLFLDDFFA